MLYTDSHEWVNPQGQVAVVGISQWARNEIGQVVFIQLPERNTKFSKGDLVCVLESTKAAADIYAPISGEIIDVNDQLIEEPKLLNSSPEDEGWIFKLQIHDPKELEELMTQDVYYKLVMS